MCVENIQRIAVLAFAVFTVFKAEAKAEDIYDIPIDQIEVRDPFIFTDHTRQCYYLHVNTNPTITVYKSKDLKYWKKIGASFTPDANFWGKKDFWAPDLYHYNNSYYLFVTFSGENGKRGTSVLISDHPEGPFKPVKNEPVTPKEQMCLDASLFIDKENQPWLVYCREWLEVVDGQVVIQKLSRDLKDTADKPVVLFSASQSGWAGSISGKEEYVTDAPIIYYEENGELTMSWSSFTKENRYAIGLAKSKSGNPAGPWEHIHGLVNDDHGGHSMLFHDLSGKLHISYHSPNSGPCYLTIRPLVKSGDKWDLQAPLTTLQKIPFADPFIMLHRGTYYAYGTHAADGIAVCTSDDLYHWKKVERLALHKDNVWGDKWFWAPEVYFLNGKFYMYYTANEHICVAESNSPLGPFRQKEQKPMLGSEKCIDNTLFIDNGKPYMFFDRFNDGLNIWSVELDDNFSEMNTGTLTPCIHVSQKWETVWPRVNEGSFVIKHKDTYYMTYSANSYESKYYGIGVATSGSINGPWVKYEKNPIYQRVGNLVGVGHSAMFTDKEGNLRIVFHAHNHDGKIHPRHMYISTVHFKQENGQEIMTIDKNFITPVWK